MPTGIARILPWKNIFFELKNSRYLPFYRNINVVNFSRALMMTHQPPRPVKRAAADEKCAPESGGILLCRDVYGTKKPRTLVMRKTMTQTTARKATE